MNVINDDDDSFLAYEDFCEVLSRLLVTVETDSGCAPPTIFRTDEGVG